MKSYKEYKERKEAQKYFRKNNDMFLQGDEWIKTLIPGVLWALIIGAIYGLLVNVIPFEFSIFYLVIGVMIANICNTACNKSGKQVGMIAVFCTIIAFMTSTFVQLASFMPLITALTSTLSAFLNQGLLGTICMIAGCVAAYLQGSENKFM